MKKDGSDVISEVLSIENDEGMREESAPHPLESLHVELCPAAEPGELLRVETAELK